MVPHRPQACPPVTVPQLLHLQATLLHPHPAFLQATVLQLPALVESPQATVLQLPALAESPQVTELLPPASPPATVLHLPPHLASPPVMVPQPLLLPATVLHPQLVSHQAMVLQVLPHPVMAPPAVAAV